MFMIFSKEKILSYLVSLSTVALLFVLSFAITKKNDEILKTSANAVMSNATGNIEASEEVVNPNAKTENKTDIETSENILNQNEISKTSSNAVITSEKEINPNVKNQNEVSNITNNLQK